MKKIRIGLRCLWIPLLIIPLLPFVIAWENVTLHELLSSDKAKKLQQLEEEKRIKEEVSSLKISPLRIIQKMNSALLEAGSLKCKMDIWLQHPVLHTNIHLDQELQDLDNAYITGRTSLSMLIPGTKYSTSEWIQSYSLGGRSYVFNTEKKHWEKEKLKLSKEKEFETVEYGLFQSLATPKSDLVLEDTVSIISLQKYKDRDCFVLKFDLDPSFFKQWKVVGKIDNYKAWVDRQNFFPYLFRLEGSIGDLKFLQVVENFDFNSPVTFKVPAEITEQMEKENKQLIQKTKDLIEKIKTLRGGEPPEGLKIDFISRKKIRTYIKEKVAEEYDHKELYALETILKWLNLVPHQFDYKEMLINSSTSSIAGFYEPKEKAFYIADWIPEYLIEPVLSHELMHAFQDNKIDLKNYLKGQKHLDQLYARKFLIEGEATAVMLQFVFDKQDKGLENDKDLLSVIKERLSDYNPSASGSGYSNLTYSGYAYGARFIQRAINSVGWKNLDRFYKEAPATMKELMHPEIYFEKNKENKEINWPALSLKGWQKFYQNSLGEFFVKMWLEKSLNSQEAESLAETLETDEIMLYNGEGQKEPLIIFLTSWDSTENAKKFQAAFQKLQEKKLKDRVKKQEEKNYMVWHSDRGDDFITLNNNLALIASAPVLNKEQIDILSAVFENSQKD